MPICIGGMHRSGTSMLARLLHLCGLNFGPESELLRSAPDNQDGFWENINFVNLNDEILARLHGSWETPQGLTKGWESRPEIVALESKALDLIDLFGKQSFWCWKDPRNSLTFAFWKKLIPDLRLVACIRNPLEVMKSLQKRHASSGTDWLNLWLTYNHKILTGLDPTDRIITHYNSYFEDPQAELLRVARLLNIPASRDTINNAATVTCASLRHHKVTIQELLGAHTHRDILKCYADICTEAGPSYRRTLRNEPTASVTALSFVDALEKSYQDAVRVIDLSSRVSGLAVEAAAKDKTIQELSAQIAEKDQAIQSLNGQVTGLTGNIAALGAEIATSNQAVSQLRIQVEDKDRAMAIFRAETNEKRCVAEHLTSEVETLNRQLADLAEEMAVVRGQIQKKDAAVQTIAAHLHDKDLALVAAQASANESAQQLSLKDRTVQALSEQMLHQDQVAQQLQIELRRSESSIALLEAQVQRQERTAQTLLVQLEDMQSSMSWRLAQRLREIRLIFAPTGSRRQYLLRHSVKACLYGVNLPTYCARAINQALCSLAKLTFTQTSDKKSATGLPVPAVLQLDCGEKVSDRMVERKEPIDMLAERWQASATARGANGAGTPTHVLNDK